MTKKKILLAMLPYWTPLIPPMGIACLKSFLQKNHFVVKTADANIEEKFRELYDRYFEALKQYVPGNRKGNFYNIGHDVLRNHMMAHLSQNNKDEKEYFNVVKILIFKTFFFNVTDGQIAVLDKIINQFYSRLEKYFLNLLEKEKPSVVGLSVYSGNVPASLFAFKLTKENYPQIKTVMGGGIFADQLALASPNLDLFSKRTPYLDKIFIGEGENLFLKWLNNELPGSQKIYTIKDIEGKTLDLSSPGIPDFSDFDLRYYHSLAAYASRGCPFHCNFCSETVRWGKYRKKSAKQVGDELMKLHKKYHYQLFLLSDSLLNPVISGLANELVKADVSIYWDGYLRIDKQVCDSENTLLWRRGGFYRARIGVESGSQRVLSWMNKKITVEQIRTALSALAYAGIKTTTYWIIGYPGETGEDFRKTLELVEELKDDIYEAEGNTFWFYLFGEQKSDFFGKKIALLYPEEINKMLMIRTWLVHGEPSREETYARLTGFVEHCDRLGIPNPYSLHDIYKADERWKRLHKNAAPSLVEFRNRSVNIDENKKVKKLFIPGNVIPDEGDFGF